MEPLPDQITTSQLGPRNEALPPGAGLHVGIIMDGNGRWAQARGLPRSAGHRVGAAREPQRAPEIQLPQPHHVGTWEADEMAIVGIDLGTRMLCGTESP